MKVSVLMITYNHKKFIAQAIDSVLMQEVDFEYEIVIGEDCSTDNTRNIVIDFQKKYPQKIRLLLPEKNLGMHNNLITTLKACKGKYVAVLEGDDYWSSPHKLQKQADFLDKYPECSICFHNATELYEDKSQKIHSFTSDYPQQILDIEDLLAQNFAYTCTAMFRRILFTHYKFPDWYSQGLVPVGDYPLWIFNAEHGKIGYLFDVMGVYRIQNEGIWSSKNKVKQLQDEIIVNEYINKYLNLKYQDIIKNKISLFHSEIAKEYEKKGDHVQAIKYLKKLLIESLFSPMIPKNTKLKMSIKLSYKILKNLQIKLKNNCIKLQKID